MTDPKPESWAPCPPGELERLAARLAFLRRLRAAAAVAGLLLAAAGAAVAARASYEALSRPSDPATQPTPCGDCHCPPDR